MNKQHPKAKRWFRILGLTALGGLAGLFSYRAFYLLGLVDFTQPVSSVGVRQLFSGESEVLPIRQDRERYSGAPHPIEFDKAGMSSPSDPSLAPPVFPATPQFLPAGTHLQLTIEASVPEAVIRYSIDGSPVATNSTVYTKPIVLENTVVVRARVFVGALASEEAIRTYFFGVEHTLPIVSLAAPASNFEFKNGYLFGMGDALGPQGEVLESYPYFGANAWQDREIEVALEFFETDHQSKLRQRAGLRVFGGWGSRCYPQKSLALSARRIYGKGKFHYAFFPDRKLDKFESLLLRNSGNDNQSTHQLAPRSPIREFGTPRSYGAYFVNGNFTLLRDAMEQRLLDGTGLDTQASRPVVVYLNGEYWGIYGLREKINQAYIQSHYGYDKGDFDLIYGWGSPLAGTGEAYFAMHRFIAGPHIESPANLAKVASQFLDVDNFIDYHLAVIYFQNFDIGNIKCWRPHSGDGRFRWIVYDQDCGFNLWPPQVYLRAMARDYADYRNMFEFCTSAQFPGGTWPNGEGRTLLLRRMLENEEFKRRFIERCADLLNTQFREERVVKVIESMASEIRPEIPRHLQRWSWPELKRRGFGPPFQPEYAPFVQATWETNIAGLVEFARQRPTQLRKHCSEHFHFKKGLADVEIRVTPAGAGGVQLNTAILHDFPWSGKFFQEYPLVLSALPIPGYRFVGWSGTAGDHSESHWKTDLNRPKYTFNARFEAVSPAHP